MNIHLRETSKMRIIAIHLVLLIFSSRCLEELSRWELYCWVDTKVSIVCMSPDSAIKGERPIGDKTL